MSIRIITDSASDIIDHNNQNLTILPMTISFGAATYLDGITLSHHGFYEKLIECDTLPKTSQISPYDFASALANATRAGETPVIITMSSRLSGTYQSAIIAAADFPDAIVIDSETVCVGQRILVEYALRLVNNGLPAVTVAEKLNQKKKNIRLIALLDTLEYLRRGGRVSSTAGFVSNLLSIKPVISIENGEVVVLGKARGSKNGNNLLSQLIAKSNGVDFSMPYALGYTGLDDELLQKYIQDSAAVWHEHASHLPYGSVGGTIGTHAGPGAIAVAFFCNP